MQLDEKIDLSEILRIFILKFHVVSELYNMSIYSIRLEGTINLLIAEGDSRYERSISLDKSKILCVNEKFVIEYPYCIREYTLMRAEKIPFKDKHGRIRNMVMYMLSSPYIRSMYKGLQEISFGVLNGPENPVYPLEMMKSWTKYYYLQGRCLPILAHDGRYQ